MTTVLQTLRLPSLENARMVLAFSGWMDGGDVSTGTVQRLVDHFDAQPFAHIDADRFYIQNFPGAMEIAAMFRPHVEIEDGIINSYTAPTNTFYVSEPQNLVLFIGKEPNLYWTDFGDAIFELAAKVGVSTILFVGSFGGTVPHTREPRLYCTVSDRKLLPRMKEFGLRPSDYEGPGSFTTYLMTQAGRRGIDMASIVAEIPGYLQGANPLSIEAVTRRLALLLDVHVDLSPLRSVSTQWELKVTEAVEKDDDLARQVRELEEAYDNELIGQGEASE